MPRNSSGVYSLPAGNPVIPDTLIESTWANPTMSDIGQALTESLPRNGAAPMTGPLLLSSDAITQARQAVSKAYVDSFLAYATGMPIGAVTAYAVNSVPAGWLLCNGQAVSRTTYAGLFATLGTIYGAGDGVNTFNVPDLRNEFIRGRDTQTLGVKYPALFGNHTHGISITTGVENANHTHGFTTGGMSANANHTHTITDPTHAHSIQIAGGTGGGLNTGGANANLGSTNTAAASTGITGTNSANVDHTHTGATGGIDANHAHNVSGDTGNTGGAETAPQHMVMNYIIKAVEDAPASGTVVTVTVASVVPATAPPFVGAMYVDQVLNKVYVATGTAASTDWSLLN